ncbi:MAG: hypothetical protein ACHREM_25530, partial [Polyangiales bacterium]
AIAEAQLAAAKAEAAAANSELAAARRKATARHNATVDVGGQHIALVSSEEASQAQYTAHGAAAKATSAIARIAEQKANVERLRLALVADHEGARVC